MVAAATAQEIFVAADKERLTLRSWGGVLKFTLRRSEESYQWGEGARIENHTVRLHSERFNLKDLLLEIIQHYNEQLAMNRRDDVQLQYQPKDIFLEAERQTTDSDFQPPKQCLQVLKKVISLLVLKKPSLNSRAEIHVMRVIVRFIPILRKYIGMYRISIKIQSQKQ